MYKRILTYLVRSRKIFYVPHRHSPYNSPAHTYLPLRPLLNNTSTEPGITRKGGVYIHTYNKTILIL